MALESITKFSFPVSEIPIELVLSHWILEYPKHSFVEVHMDDEEDPSGLYKWIMNKYPELKNQNSFFIHIDIPKDEQNN